MHPESVSIVRTRLHIHASPEQTEQMVLALFTPAVDFLLKATVTLPGVFRGCSPRGREGADQSTWEELSLLLAIQSCLTLWPYGV